MHPLLVKIYQYRIRENKSVIINRSEIMTTTPFKKNRIIIVEKQTIYQAYILGKEENQDNKEIEHLKVLI